MAQFVILNENNYIVSLEERAVVPDDAIIIDASLYLEIKNDLDHYWVYNPDTREFDKYPSISK